MNRTTKRSFVLGMIKPELGGMLAGNRTGSEGIQSGRRGCRSPECYTKPDRTKKDANIMYLRFQEALQEEKEKLHVKLQRSRTIDDSKQCRVIEYLIDVTENVVNVLPGKKVHKLLVN
ncbi:Uncharacterized protein TCM_042500 [Theobroma cacao]|uniref:Uncharacterized protein n=1 Tax=Theobroma cacao TaxID=3641 RepID=A0A061FL23_THECC|nr:Uncharacterized protein TCM_042500 [Theobroma cacao]